MGDGTPVRKTKIIPEPVEVPDYPPDLDVPAPVVPQPEEPVLVPS